MGVREALLAEGRFEGLEKGLEKGLELGREGERKTFVKSLLKQTTFSTAHIAKLVGVSDYYVRKVKRLLKK